LPVTAAKRNMTVRTHAGKTADQSTIADNGIQKPMTTRYLSQLMATRWMFRGKRPEPRRPKSAFIAAGLAALALTVSTGYSTAEPKPTAASDGHAANSAAQRKVEELQRWVAQRGGKVSIVAVDLKSGQRVAEYDAGLALNPASNMKVVTAAAALDMLGPHFSFQTGLYGKLQTPKTDRLVLRGHGDPSLTEASLWRLANAVYRQGVTEVGEIAVDQSHFDEQFVPPGFDQQPKEWAPFRAPVSAIALQRNSVTLHVAPTTPGEAARTWFEPAGVVESTGQVQTSKAGRGQAVQWTLESKNGKLSATIGGRVAAGLPRQRFSRRLDDPRLAPGQNLAAHLKTMGIKVGPVKLGGTDEQTRITYVTSPPLSELVHELGKHSDNFYAEMLFKALATASDDHPKSSAAAAKIVGDWLQKQGAWTEGDKIINGSGLFDTNRLSAASLASVLRVAYDNPRLRTEFISQLAIGGVDGTLRSRFKKLAQRRVVRAKTGTLRNVISLSGYVLRNGTQAPIAFSMLVNDAKASPTAIRQRVDAVVEALAE
jgi:D-alanyl-D-alanine carboxypeptidase/D-alanyl-D-alanine-endopeptidase (penicillin-binding protein 4)